MKTLTEALAWRYATKKFDPTKKLTDAQLYALLETVRMAPTSLGLQPFRVFLVTSSDVRMKLRAAAWNQPQVTDASHFMVFAAMTNISEVYVDSFIARTAKSRGVTVESLKGFSDMVKGYLGGRGADTVWTTAWSARQAYLAHGMMVATAAFEGIDMVSLEGFDPKQFDEILGLTAQGFTSVVAAAVGARAVDDAYAAYPKTRLSMEEIVHEVK